MKKSVAAGMTIVGVAAGFGVGVYSQNPGIIDEILGNKPAQTEQIIEVEQHNVRIESTNRENMVIECNNQIEFINSFNEMKNKMPKEDQEKLNQAFNKIIQKRKLSEENIDENLCSLFKGWTERQFFEEAEK